MSSEFVPFLKGDFDARQHKIYNLPDGVDPSDAATVGQLGGGGSQPSIYSLTKAVCTFNETTGAGTYTATVPVIAGGRILEVVAFVVAGPWNASTSAVINAGDTAHPSGYLDGSDTNSDLLTWLVKPFDATNVQNLPDAGAPYSASKSWQDGLLQETASLYSGAAALYTFIGNNFVPGVPYPAGDNIVVTVVTVGETTGPIETTSIGTNAGAGYAPGDTGTVGDNVTGDGSGATYVVDTVDGGGAVLTFAITAPGTGYTPGADAGGLTPTSGGGDGNQSINIDSVDLTNPGSLVVDVIGFGVTPQTFAAVKT